MGGCLLSVAGALPRLRRAPCRASFANLDDSALCAGCCHVAARTGLLRMGSSDSDRQRVVLPSGISALRGCGLYCDSRQSVDHARFGCNAPPPSAELTPPAFSRSFSVSVCCPSSASFSVFSQSAPPLVSPRRTGTESEQASFRSLSPVFILLNHKKRCCSL